MLDFIKRSVAQKRIDELTRGAERYARANFYVSEEDQLRELFGYPNLTTYPGSQVQVIQNNKPKSDSEYSKEPRQNVKYSIDENPDATSKLWKDVLVVQSGSVVGFSKGLDGLLEKSFSEKLADLIRDKGLRDSDVYNAAQMDRRLFSKIMSNKSYKPSKDTAFALIFALKLSISEANDLLSSAGYKLSRSVKRDLVVEYLLRENVYNLIDINMILDNLGLKLIGR